MNEMSFNGAIDCATILNFLFEGTQAKNFELYDRKNDMTLGVLFETEEEASRSVCLDVFWGRVVNDNNMSEETLSSIKGAEIVIVSVGDGLQCEIIDRCGTAREYLPFNCCWPLLKD